VEATFEEAAAAAATTATLKTATLNTTAKTTEKARADAAAADEESSGATVRATSAGEARAVRPSADRKATKRSTSSTMTDIRT
jgi:hypothetical protein